MSTCDMERDYRIFKTQISLIISSDDPEIDPLSVTEDLQLKPSRMQKKGDTTKGERTGYIHIIPRTVWTIDSEWTVFEENTVSHHIEYFKTILVPKSNVLKRYKDDGKFNVTFWIWIETDDAGIGFDLSEDDLTFLNTFSNRVSFSLIAGTKIE